MTELIQQITSQLNIDASQAEGGVGLIAKLAQDKLGGDFSQLTSAVPGLADMVSKAPESGGAASGLGGMVGSALSAVGASDLGNLASLAGGFKALGLDAGMVAQFAPLVTNYLTENGGDTVKALLDKVL